MEEAGFEQFIYNISSNMGAIQSQSPNIVLTLIFDYDKLNEYGKMIIDKTATPSYSDLPSILGQDNWGKSEYDVHSFKTAQQKRAKLRELVQFYQEHRESDGSADFTAIVTIFWAMMVLTVDPANGEEYLGSICDLAKMFGLTDNDLRNIYRTVKVCYMFEEMRVKLNLIDFAVYHSILCDYPSKYDPIGRYRENSTYWQERRKNTVDL